MYTKEYLQMIERFGQSSESLEARLQMGADQELLTLFGGTQDDRVREDINERRRELLAPGFLTEADLGVGAVSNPGLLSVQDHGTVLYPKFQFEAGSLNPLPKAAITNYVLKSLDPTANSWEIASWWISGNGYLDDKTPLEVLQGHYPEDMLLSAVYGELHPTQF